MLVILLLLYRDVHCLGTQANSVFILQKGMEVKRVPIGRRLCHHCISPTSVIILLPEFLFVGVGSWNTDLSVSQVMHWIPLLGWHLPPAAFTNGCVKKCVCVHV